MPYPFLKLLNCFLEFGLVYDAYSPLGLHVRVSLAACEPGSHKHAVQGESKQHAHAKILENNSTA